MQNDLSEAWVAMTQDYRVIAVLPWLGLSWIGPQDGTIERWANHWRNQGCIIDRMYTWAAIEALELPIF